MVCGRIPCASATVETIRGTRSSCNAKTSRHGKGGRMSRPRDARRNWRRRVAPRRAGPSPPGGRFLPRHSARPIPGQPRARHRLAGVPSAGAAGDDPEIREARQAGHDLFGQPLGQRRDVGVGAAVLERQHGDPEAFVRTRARRARSTRTGSTCGRWSSTRRRHLSREVAAFIGDITRGLDALTRILLQAASNQAREVGRQIAAQVGDERRRVAQDRRRQFGRRRTREGTFTARHLVEKDAEREDVAAVIHGAARDLLRRHVGRRTHHDAMFGVPG